MTTKGGGELKFSILAEKMELSRGSLSNRFVLHPAEFVLVDCCCCCCRHADILHHKVFRVILPTE